MLKRWIDKLHIKYIHPHILKLDEQIASIEREIAEIKVEMADQILASWLYPSNIEDIASFHNLRLTYREERLKELRGKRNKDLATLMRLNKTQ